MKEVNKLLDLISDYTTSAANSEPETLLANALRLVASGLLAYLVGPAAAQGLFHEAAGLAVFGLECAMVLAGAWALR